MDTPKQKRGRPPKSAAAPTPDPVYSTETIEAALMVQIDGFIDAGTVSKLTSLSTQEIRRRVSEQRFPRPIQIGEMRKAWRISQVRNWIDHMATVSHTEHGGTYVTN